VEGGKEKMSFLRNLSSRKRGAGIQKNGKLKMENVNWWKSKKVKKGTPYCFFPLLGGRLRGGTYQLVSLLTCQLKEKWKENSG